MNLQKVLHPLRHMQGLYKVLSDEPWIHPMHHLSHMSSCLQNQLCLTPCRIRLLTSLLVMLTLPLIIHNAFHLSFRSCPMNSWFPVTVMWNSLCLLLSLCIPCLLPLRFLQDPDLCLLLDIPSRCLQSHIHSSEQTLPHCLRNSFLSCLMLQVLGNLLILSILQLKYLFSCLDISVLRVPLLPIHLRTCYRFQLSIQRLDSDNLPMCLLWLSLHLHLHP